MSKQYKVGAQVYFKSYGRADVEKVIRPGSKVTIKEETKLDGKSAFVVETSKGDTDTVLKSELKTKSSNRINKDQVGEAVDKAAKEEKTKKTPEQLEEERIQAANEREREKIMQLGNFIVTSEVQEVIDQHDDALKAALHVDETMQRNHWRMGGILAYIYFTEDFLRYNKTFREFADKQLPTIGQRTAYTWLKLYTRLTNLGITESQVVDIGYTKLAAIAAIGDLNKTIVKDLLKYASKNSLKSLKSYITDNYEPDEKAVEEAISLRGDNAVNNDAERLIHYKMSVFESQSEVIEQAIELIVEQNPEFVNSDGTPKLGQVFAMLAANYMNTVNDQDDSLTPEKYLEYGESMFANKEVFMRDRLSGEVLSTNHSKVNISTEGRRNKQKVEQVA